MLLRSNHANLRALIRFSTASSLADKLHSQVRSKTSDLEKSLSDVNPKLDTKSVIDVIDRCSPSQAQMGLRFFIWAGTHQGYRHSPYAYERACKLFDINGNPRLIYDVVEAYRSERCVVSVKTFKVVLNLCKEAELGDAALWVLREMSEFGLRGDSTMYGVVLRLFCQKGDLDSADSLMKEVLESGHVYPSVVTFIEMVNGFCKAGRFDDAFRLIKVASEQGCGLNTVLYTSLVDGLCKTGDVERGMELLEGMERRGGEVSPNVVTYTCVLQRLCDDGRTVEALEILDRMVARGCFPNRVTVNCLIERFCKEGRGEEVYGLIGKIVGTGGVSYEVCYSAFVAGLIKNGRFEEAERVFSQMIASGLRPDGLACSIVLKEICSSGRILDGYRICYEIEKFGCSQNIDSDIYSNLLTGLCQQEHFSEAAELAGLMLKKGIRPQGTYADRIFQNLKKAGDAI